MEKKLTRAQMTGRFVLNYYVLPIGALIVIGFALWAFKAITGY